MKKLWVTYAWKENEDFDVDFIIQELREVGLMCAMLPADQDDG